MSAIYRSATGAQEIARRYTEALGAWPVAAEHHHIPTHVGETFVVASGPIGAPPLVLLHGSGANTTAWRDDVESWSRHFRTYAVDLVGEPGRSAPTRPPLDSDACASWLDAVLDEEGIGNAALLGMSLGAWTALDYAIRRPERVTRLALLCPGGIGRQKVGWIPRALLLRLFGRRGIRRSAATVTGLHGREYRQLLDEVALTFTQFRPRTRLPVFGDEALRGVRVPVQVTVGDSDVLFDSAGTARRVRECIPHADVMTLPGVGHAVFGRTEPLLEFLLEDSRPGGDQDAGL
ncbi:alpha/beta fold hydrolase [Rhodococcus triatomae]|uniref:Pimeloyl-ACP methyl ester carboxylesterase n=1 Tax=Rhodococcus triatomae TaxID=300028 RepID=A0A1G8P004_9NOCA|nr:alpha/beta fold hydrolase [Rhodococcus triatomae]QNG18789.1 alpha/beta fold hydrolase [Rhodococcus triatomae]QNG25300.1 alpha/beta fold hydrolase [Rhodococcus triatomae]SDI85695.1 Pimeloyl-ACP methyl ester carboxylesterase [Rhodococcus triatomae]